MKKMTCKSKNWIALLMALVLALSAMPFAAAESFSAVVSSGSMSVYANASLTKRLGALDKYTVVTVTDYSGGVARISYNDRTGYARVSDMERVDDVAIAAVMTASAKVYEEPDLESRARTVREGTLVNLIAVNEDWALVEREGIGAYVQLKYLKEIEAEPTVTPTPKPTATPEPVEEITVDTFYAQVTASSAVVYESASAGSGKLGVLSKGTQVKVTAYNSTWARVEKDGKTGYARIADLKRLPDATPTPAPTATPSAKDAVPATVVAASAKVYKSANTASKYLGKIKKGQEVNVIDYSGKWAYIELDGKYGYCALSALVKTSELPTATPTPTPAPTATPSTEDAIPATVTVTSAKVYAGASTSAKYIGKIKKGQQVNVLKYSGSWAFIELDGKFGYCALSALTKNSDLATPTPAPTATPSTKDAIPATVTVTSAKVYAGASTSAEYIGKIKKGQQVNVLKYSGNWAFIELDGKFGYCALSALTKNSDLATPTPAPTATPSTKDAIEATVIVSSAKVYQSPSKSSKYLGKIKLGQEVNVIDYNDDWAFIEMDGKYGYCALGAVMPALPVEDAVVAQVTASSLNFYAAPSTSAKHIGRLSKGKLVNVLQVVDGWAYVERSGNYGWCQVSGLGAVEAEPTATPTPDPMADYKVETFEATVISGSSKIYASASTDAASKSVSLGTNVTVRAYTSKWAAVEIGDTQGFMLVADLSRSEFSTLASGSSGSAVATLEKALLSMGYLDEMPDTTYNSYTEEAVKLFQTACGMPVTGKADAATQRVLFSGNAPSSSLLSNSYEKGDSGAGVTRIQRRLYGLKYLSKSTSIDGDFGNNTYNAIKLFQAANGLTTSGTADSATLRKLYSTSAEPLPSGKTPGDVATPGGNVSAGDQANNAPSISSGLASTTTSYSSGMSWAQKVEYMIYVAQNQLGKPYIYATSGPSSFDCSGFTTYCYKQIGISLPRTAYTQGYNTAYDRINDISDLRRGDLVYFNTISDSDACDHAGIYLGSGWFIHASSGQAKVVVSSLASGYYNRVFSWGHSPN